MESPSDVSLPPRPMNKAFSGPDYSDLLNGRSRSEEEAGNRNSSVNGIPSSKKFRSLSLQHSVGYYDEQVQKQSQGLINLATMSKGLGLGNNSFDKDKKSAISFSAVGFMVESMHRMHHAVTENKTEVECAVLSQDLEALRTICESDFDAPQVGAFCAASFDKEEALNYIIDLVGGSVAKNWEENPDGDNLLHVAVKSRAENCVRLLLQLKFNPNGWNRKGSGTPMHYAAVKGFNDILIRLIEDDQGNVNAGEKLEGQSVLHAAVRANQPHIVRTLLGYKANKIGRGKFTETSLHVASELNHHECAQILLEDGILVDALRGANVRETALHIAAANGYYETVQLLLKYSANPNAKTAKEETPLHLASKALSCPVMRLLMDHGADVNSRDGEGRPPLHFAINSKESGVTECMQLLIDRGADINIQDRNGTSALHLASLHRKLTRVKLLIKNGADLCLKNKVGKSALYFMMKYVPNSLKAIEERMDSGLQMDNNPDHSTEHDNTIKMDFNLLIPKHENNYGYVSEIGLFTEVLSMRTNDPARLEKILMHPLCLSFLHLKWQQVKWLYYVMILFTHFVYSVTYSIYVVSVYNTVCHPEDTNEDRQGLTVQFQCYAQENKTTWDIAILSWMFLILFNIIYVFKEITKFIHLKSIYFKEWESWLNFLTIISFPMISFHVNPFGDKNVVMYGWQYHAAGIGVLFTWILQMFLVGKVPKFGKYVQMLINVGWSFLNFFIAYFTLVIGFTLSFVVLFPREITFSSALTAPIKVMVMMTGEIEYNDLYYPEKTIMKIHNTTENETVGILDEESIPHFFPFTAHSILTIFILIVSIVIMNLLFGMAVSDVQELYTKSRLLQSIQQVHLIAYMESTLFSPFFNRLPALIKSFLRNKLLGFGGRYRRNVFEIFPDSYDDKKLLPHHLNKSIKDKCNQLHLRREAQPSMKQILMKMDKMDKLESQVENMTSLLNAMIKQQQMNLGKTRSAPGLVRSLSFEQNSEEDEDESTSNLSKSSRSRKPSQMSIGEMSILYSSGAIGTSLDGIQEIEDESCYTDNSSLSDSQKDMERSNTQ